MFKRTVTLLLVLVIFATLLPLTAIGEDKAEAEYYRGKIYLTYECPDGTELEINGIRYIPVNTAENSCTLTYTVTGIDSVGSKLYLNGGELCDISQNGTAELTADILNEGENEIRIYLITNKSVIYDESMVYGEYNLDDINISSFNVTGKTGSDLELTLVKYMPVEGKAGTNAAESTYDNTSVAVGDGWNASTGLGGSAPGTPVMVGFKFNSFHITEGSVYEVDTALLPDGENTVSFYDTEKQAYLEVTETITVNNKAPEVVFPFENGGVLYKNEAVNIEIKDNISGVKSAQIYLDDNKIKTLYTDGSHSLDISDCNTGRHTVYVISSDKAGNVEYNFRFFTVTEAPVAVPDIAEGTVTAGEELKACGVTLLDNINMYTNPMGDFDNKSLRNSYEELVQFYDLGKITTTAIGNSVPYQSFLVDVSGYSGEAVISCSALTGDYSGYKAAAWNYSTSAWDVLGEAESGENITAKADISTYSKDGKMRVNLYPQVVGNGSDTMLWFTDTQYYSRYDDLNFLYKSIVEYAAREYAEGNIAYAVFTGDFIDQMGTDDEAEKEYKIADVMQKILDDAGVPNGVLAGNHDVAHTTLNYNYYLKYFSASRYNGQDCYGGSLDNNINHFDLITVGGYNFIVLYIGYGREADDKTIAWANSVLNMYSDYNAVIATHEYLLSSGVWSADASRTLWEKIAVPNENVKMILCGHNEGTCNQLREVGATGRYVLEILHNYQFAELKLDPQHVENGCTCDGEGFLRLMTFTEAGQMVMSAYSPYYELTNYYAPYDDNYIYTLDLSTESRSITTEFFAVGVNSAETDKAEGYNGFYAESSEGRLSAITVPEGTYSPNYYIISGDKPDYVKNTEIIVDTWYTGISATLSRYSASSVPADGAAYKAVSLLPTETSKLLKTSGSTEYSAAVNEEGGVSLGFTGTDSTWICVTASTERINIYENPCVYFSVTAGDSTKWNICVNTTKNKSYSFSQTLYKEFGYDDYAVPSDIIGSWHGYIDLSGLLSADECVSGIYLVNAARGETVKFDYLFIGRPVGVSATFVVNEDTKKRVDAAEGSSIDEPDAPFVPGMVFEGWFNESDEKAVFPLTLNTDGVYYAKFTEKSAITGCIYYDTETEFAEITENPKSGENSTVISIVGGDDKKITLIIIGAAAVILAAAAVMIVKIKKKRCE